MSTKLCVDCKNNDANEPLMCQRTITCATGVRLVATTSCIAARHFVNECGVNARYFEPKEPPK